MARLNRLIAVLQLFDSGRQTGRETWTVEAIGVALKTPTSTAYRHVRELVAAGFLDPVTGAAYALGPAFIRFDRILRQTDRLIQIGEPVMRRLLERTSQRATVILCRRFKDCVMCVHEVHGSQPHATTSYERGVAMPLFIGATSKIILANLPDRTLKSVYLANADTIRRVLKLRNWDAFKEQFRDIRRAGYAFTDSEVSKGRIGIAAPVLRGDQLVAGLSLVGVPRNAERARIDNYIPHVVAAATQISDMMSKGRTIVPR